jgi:hypothetical protein
MRLVHTFADSQTVKVKCDSDNDSGIAGSSGLLFNQVSSARLPPLSQVDYPLVKYWERKVWKTVAGTRKDTSEVQAKTGSRGGSRSSKGENVMMLYIEDANGMPIDGNIAGGIREHARSIWRSLYERGIAPETWGQATMEVREKYCREMESEYPVLRLCNNHWKVNAIATAIYSQWHRTYDKKMKPCPDDDDNSEGDSSDSDCNISDDDTGDGAGGPPRKKARTSTISSTISHVEDNRSSLRDPLYVTRHYLISPYC